MSFARASAAVAAALLLASPLASGEEAAAAAPGADAMDCVRPGPCDDGGESGAGVGSPPEEAPNGNGGEARSRAEGASGGGSADGGPQPVRAGLQHRSESPVSRRSGPPVRARTGADAVEHIPLARTGTDAWPLALLGAVSASGGVALLAMRRFRGRRL